MAQRRNSGQPIDFSEARRQINGIRRPNCYLEGSLHGVSEDTGGVLKSLSRNAFETLDLIFDIT